MGSSGIANPYCDEESKNQIKNAFVALYGFLLIFLCGQQKNGVIPTVFADDIRCLFTVHGKTGFLLKVL